MSIRRNLGGRYVEVRERSTSKGHKGTIMKNWSSKSKEENKEDSIGVKMVVVLFILIIIILILIYYFFF